MNPSRHLRGIVPVLLIGFALLCGTIAVKTATCRAGEYLNSAHGQHISRNDTAAAGYAVGNCAHCHEQHASINGTEPAPTGSVSVYLGFAPEENLCFGCHGSGGLGTATNNIEIDITKSYGHNPADYSGIHKANETISYISNNKHVECTDCHNPHRVGSTLHSIGSNAITPTTSPLYEVTGIEPTFSGLNWTTPIYGTLQTATKEYQLCFKCHSGANTNVTSWGGAGASAFTDVALEFSPANMSGHPVVTGLDNYTNSLDVNRGSGPYKGLHNEIDGTNWDQLLDPWGTNAGSQTMYCSDCHASNSTVAGPHGSDVKWMLGGVNKAWPFTTAAANGNSSGTYRSINTLYEWDSTYQQGLGTDNGCFCWNCHPPNRQGNNVHSNGNHSGAKCVDCHLRVPHGGKVSRLIAADNSSSSYGSMPSRYTASGTGLNSRGTAQPIVRKFTKAANWSYNRSKCYATISGCQYHQKFSNGSESW